MPRPTAKRSALLVLSLLTACAASNLASDGSEQPTHFQATGAFSDYLVGRYAAQRTDLNTAAQKLESAMKADGGVPEVTTEAFIAATLAGRPEAAQLAANLPDNPLAQLVLADVDAEDGHWIQAESRFAALPQQGLTQVLRPLLIAWAEAGQGRTDAALNVLAPFVEGQRYRGVYALHSAMIADLGGRTADASRLYQLAVQEYGPTNLRLGQIVASWQARQGNLAEGRSTIDQMAGVNGDLAIARPGLNAAVSAPVIRNAADGIAEAYLALAATLHQQGSESAQVLLQLALDLRTDLTAARLLLADIESEANHPGEALQSLSGVAPTDPLIAVVELRRASLLEETGHSDEAGHILDTLAQQQPDRPEPLAEQGDFLRRKNRFPEAVASYNAAIARIGTPTRANWPLFYERGIAEERAGQWPQAESDFQYALRLAPDQPGVLNYLGFAWTERGEHLEQAKTMIQRALQQRPNDGAIVDSLGWVMLQQGDKAGALQQLERAVELEPEDSVINGHLGDALDAVGRTREAEFQWRRALTLKPEAEDAKKLTEKLNALANTTHPAQAAVPSAAQPR